MKQALQSLIQRPSSWLSLLSAALLVVVIMSPDEPKNEDRPSEDGVSAPELESGHETWLATADEPGKPDSGPPAKSLNSEPPPPETAKTAASDMPPSKGEVPVAVPVPVPATVPPASAMKSETAPKPVPDRLVESRAMPEQPRTDQPSPVQATGGASLVEPMGPPTPAELAERFKLANPVEQMGPPSLEEIAEQWARVWVGPWDPVEQTRLWVQQQMGPPSPAEIGPPLEAMNEEAKALLAEKAASQAMVASGDGGKTAGGKGGIAKPTTRITPPAASKDVKGAKDEMDGDGHKTGPEPEDDAKMVANQKDQPEPPPLSEEPLPPATGNVWKVVKVDGRDYVTGDSIQLFYRFSTHKVDGKHVWFRNPNLIIKGQIGSQELLVNNIKFILSYPVLSQGGKALFSRLDLCKLIEPVIRPSYIGSSSVFDTVVLDAGHGGHDAGARGVYGYEKNYALAMVLAVREALMKKGFKVVLTRSNDTFLSLSSRVAVANRTPNSIFISIHFNSGGSAASGIETFALTPQGSASSLARGGGFSNTARLGNQFDSENIALATAVHAQVVHRFKLIDRGIKRARWSVLSGCQRPGILFEGGFVTNARECQLIASDSYRKAVAQAVADAVSNYRAALAPRPARR